MVFTMTTTTTRKRIVDRREPYAGREAET